MQNIKCYYIRIDVTKPSGYEKNLIGNRKIYLLKNLQKGRFKCHQGPNKSIGNLKYERENVHEIGVEEEFIGIKDNILTWWKLLHWIFNIYPIQ